MKNYDEQIKIQERLKQHGIFSSSLVPSPYADIIEQLLNKLSVYELIVSKLSDNGSLNVETSKKNQDYLIDTPLNIVGVVKDGNGLQSNETNSGKSEDEPVHATETTASPATGSRASSDATTTEPTEPTA